MTDPTINKDKDLQEEKLFCEVARMHFKESKMMQDKGAGDTFFRRDLLDQYVLACGMDNDFKNKLINQNL